MKLQYGLSVLMVVFLGNHVAFGLSLSAGESIPVTLEDGTKTTVKCESSESSGCPYEIKTGLVRTTMFGSSMEFQVVETKTGKVFQSHPWRQISEQTLAQLCPAK